LAAAVSREAIGFSTAPVLQGALVAWHGLFSQAELDALARHCDALVLEQAGLSGSEQNRIRETKVAWVIRNAATEAFYCRMEEVVLALNARFFRYDLSQLVTFQYAVYDGGGHFDWHKDYGRAYGEPGQEPRKLTLSLQLSASADYDGCDLEVRGGNEVDSAPRERGCLIAFPANVLHRVTPLTRGVRKSLVIWAAGPEFR
jgi:PKHD-type hydroxylase